jgi:outer membrane lipopolysaccharide assembly protein LptE/RlpB
VWAFADEYVLGIEVLFLLWCNSNFLRFGLKMRVGCLAAVLLLAVGLTGCGYRFSGTGDLPESVQRVAVPMFDNPTGETGVEQIFTNDVIYELTRGGLTTVAPRADPEAVLYGRIASITTETISRSTTITATERRLSVTLTVHMLAEDGRMLTDVTRLSDSQTYPVATDPLVTEENRRAALRKLSQRMAEKVYYRLTDDF